MQHPSDKGALQILDCNSPLQTISIFGHITALAALTGNRAICASTYWKLFTHKIQSETKLEIKLKQSIDVGTSHFQADIIS